MDKKCISSGKEESCLKKLKEKYSVLKEKHSLPDFAKLNEEFHIERIADLETDFLIREIRRFISERFSEYLRFIEAVLNPVSAQLFVFSILKSLDSKDKKVLAEIYKNLSKKEIESIGLDIQYSEEKEANFIKDSLDMWEEIKVDLVKVIEKIKTNWDTDIEIENKEKGYFG